MLIWYWKKEGYILTLVPRDEHQENHDMFGWGFVMLSYFFFFFFYKVLSQALDRFTATSLSFYMFTCQTTFYNTKKNKPLQSRRTLLSLLFNTFITSVGRFSHLPFLLIANQWSVWRSWQSLSHLFDYRKFGFLGKKKVFIQQWKKQKYIWKWRCCSVKRGDMQIQTWQFSTATRGILARSENLLNKSSLYYQASSPDSQDNLKNIL